ncbi:MAG TPA: hypothetical protein VGG34_14070 [Opitutaceae bacterium]|jgi:hypothetical protein
MRRVLVAAPVALLLALPGTRVLAGSHDRLPAGDAGIAARHPGDKGIGKDPAVVFADDFDGCPSVGALRPKWDVLINQAQLSIADAAASRPGRGRCLLMTIPKQEAPLATAVSKVLAPTQDVLFVRWYQRFDAGWFVPDGSVHNGGTISSRYFDHGRATPGVPADGRNKFLVNFENENSTGEAPGRMDMYVYWPEQGSQWGDHFYPSGYVLPYSVNRSGKATFGRRFVPRPDFSPQTGRWYCYEYMVRANTPGKRDGRIAGWVDGRLIADFPNLRLRDVADLRIDRFDIGLYIAHNADRTNRKWVDDVVAATSYIGPVAGPQ